jgi:succinate-semialdehyde dehydrogenase/glutarate-semialdehyde dehydrogenase
MYINGQWIGEGLDYIEVTNPADNKIIATVPQGGSDEAKQAVDAAHKAFKEWSQYSAYERAEIIRKWY